MVWVLLVILLSINILSGEIFFFVIKTFYIADHVFLMLNAYLVEKEW